MATSGSITTSKYQGRYYKLAWERTSYSIANNTSTIKWTLSAHGGSSSWYAERTLKAVINGKTVFSKTARKERYTGTIDTGTLTIAHNSDGTKTFSMSLKAAVYTSSVNCTGSGNQTLTAIPRQANLTAAPNFNDEQNPTITYNNPAGNSVTSLDACIANDSGSVVYVPYRAVTKTGTSYTFTLTEAERNTLRNACTTAKNMQVRFYLRTIIGGNTYYSTLGKILTITNANPVITAEAYDDMVLSTKLTGDNSKIIKGYNGVYVSMTSSALKGATIVNEYIINNNKIHDITSGTIDNVVNPSFTFYAKDSRGNETKKTITLSMIDYMPLTCNVDGSIVLDSEDSSKATLTFKVSGNYWNGIFGAFTNGLEFSYSIYDSGGGISYGSVAHPELDGMISGNSYSKTITISNLDYRKSYRVSATVKDAIGTVTSESKTFQAIPIFDWGQNDFNFNVPVSINGINLFELIYPVGAIYMSTVNTNPSNYFGGTWEAWGSGRVPVGVNTSDSNFNTVEKTGGASTHTLTTAQIPAHTHGSKSLTGQIPNHVFYGGQSNGSNGIVSATIYSKRQYAADGTSNNGWATISINATHEHTSVGGGQAHNNLQPYITCYMWKRIA